MGLGKSYDQWRNQSHYELPPVVLASGPETEMKDEFVQKIRDQFPDSTSEHIRLSADEITPGDLMQELQGKGLFQDSKLVQLKRLGLKEGGRTMLRKFMDTLEEYVEDPEPDVVLVLQDRDHPYKNGRKTGKLARVVEDAGGWSIVFWEPFDSDLKNELKSQFQEAGISIQPDALQLLLEKTDGKYARARKEVEKIIQLDIEKVNRDIVESVVSREAADDAFDALRENVASGDLADAIRRLDDLWRRQESPVKVFRILLGFFIELQEIEYLQRKGNSLQEALSEAGLPDSKSVKKRYRKALNNVHPNADKNFYRRAFETEQDAKYSEERIGELQVEKFLRQVLTN